MQNRVQIKDAFVESRNGASPARANTIRYTVVGNVVTLEFSITITNPGTFAFTTATDYFTGLPAAIQPTSQQQFSVFSPITDGWQLAMFYNAGLWKMFFVKSGSPTFGISVPPDPAGTYRWTVTYLL